MSAVELTVKRRDFVRRSRIDATCSEHGSLTIHCPIDDVPRTLQHFVNQHISCSLPPPATPEPGRDECDDGAHEWQTDLDNYGVEL